MLPKNDALADANFVLDYYRLSADRRLIYGGEVSYDGRPPKGLEARIDGKICVDIVGRTFQNCYTAADGTERRQLFASESTQQTQLV